MAVEQLATSDASTLMLCQAATALIMQISTLLEKLPGSAAAFLSRKDTIALFNGKEGTRNTFLCSSGLGTCFLLPISLGNSRRGSPAPTWLREGLQGKATSKADVKGALAKTRKGTPLPSSPYQNQDVQGEERCPAPRPHPQHLPRGSFVLAWGRVIPWDPQLGRLKEKKPSECFLTRSNKSVGCFIQIEMFF